MMTMQVRRLTGTGGSPNFTARSITGTTLPRRLMTPRMYGGVVGTFVTMPYSMISFTLSTPTAYCSSARKNVRYCRWLAASFSVLLISHGPQTLQEFQSPRAFEVDLSAATA